MSDGEFEKSFDLESFLKQEQVPYHQNAKHYVLDICPVCARKDKVFIEKKSKLWICYSCRSESSGSGAGNLWTLLLSLGLDDIQVRNIFKGRKSSNYCGEFKYTPIAEQSKVEEKEVQEPVQTPQRFFKLDCSEVQISGFKEVYQYLWNRHVRSKAQIISFNLMYDAATKRIVFPSMSIEGKFVGYQCRDITDRWKKEHMKCNNHLCPIRWKYYFEGEEIAPQLCPSCKSQLQLCYYPKSTNNSNFDKTSVFFNENNVDWNKTVTLVEGPFDCINTPNSIALLGKFLSDDQFKKITRLLKAPLVLYLDGDNAGRESVVSVYNILRPFLDLIHIVNTPDGDDPGSHNILDNAKNIAQAIDPIHWFAANKLILF